MTVEFFKEKYGYEIEGFWLPRVTAVTSLVSKANAFAAREQADWGSLVHATLADILRGNNVKIDKKLAPSLRAFEQWLLYYGIKIEDEDFIEKRVFDKENLYAGTVDLVAKIQGRFGIVDFKTGSEIRKEHALQTAAYLNAYNKLVPKSKFCETRWILRLDQYQECKGCLARKREKGTKIKVSGGNAFCNHIWSETKTEIEFQELTNFEEDFQAFLSAKTLWEWYNRDWLSKIPNYPKKITQRTLI